LANRILTSSFAIDQQYLKNEQTIWSCNIDKIRVNNDTTAIDLTLNFRLIKGKSSSSGIAIAFDFSKWKTDNYVLVPGAVYNGNRFRSIKVPYPPYLYDKKDKPLDMPVTVNNIPRFNIDYSPAKIELLTGSCSTPMLCFFDKSSKRAFIMLAEQNTRLGNSGLILEEKAVDKKATFVLSAPGIREKRYTMADFEKSNDIAIEWKAGDSLKLKLRIYNFSAVNLQQFFEKVYSVRKALSGTTNYINKIPFSSLSDIILKFHDENKFSDQNEFVLMKKPGWVTVLTYPFIIKPTPQRLLRIQKAYDQLLGLQGQTGLLYGKYVNGKLLGDNYLESELKPNIAMPYKNGESLYFGLQALNSLKQEGYGDIIKPEWENMFKRIADGLMNTFKKYGQFGQFIDVQTGEMDINGSSSVSCISGLALASQYYHNAEYLKTAEKAGEYYYVRDLSKGYLGGDANEILQAPGSSAPYEIGVAYITLFEITGNRIWLKRAQDAAALLSTWVISYDYKFPNGSIMDKIDAKSTGAIFASPQNNHAAPGLYVNSANFLLKLYRATQDKRYAELLKDIVHNVVQYTNTPENVIQPHKGKPGHVSERVQLSDWEGKENIGGSIDDGDSNMHWEVVTLLSVMQNPGIYLRNDTEQIVVFDHVNAHVVRSIKSGVILKVTNTTSHDASVSVLSENAEQAKKPLGDYYFYNLPKIEIKAGETALYLVDINGKIKKWSSS
jgi:hypothetical protein